MKLFRFVLFEERSGFFEGESVAVDLEFVFAGVFGDGDNVADGVAVLPESFDDEIDVYHGRESIAVGCVGLRRGCMGF
jgi:hypothetical protein